VCAVGEFLGIHPSHNWSIGPHATVFRALEVMAEKDIGALLVMDDGKLVGIFTERDYARKVILKGRSSKETLVNELMTSPVICASPDMTIEQGMALMTEKRFRHLPVMDNNELVGIVTIRDVVKKKLSEQQVMINDLENFITGEGYVAVRS
jgi:CBS domain-containing protein